MKHTNWILFVLICSFWLPACMEAQQPAYREVVVLKGSPYERGYEHGRLLSSKIRSLYTTLLSTSMIPFLNREQGDVESFLEEYQKPLYDDGRFSYEMLLQSGQALADELELTHPEMLSEMRGVADGSGMPYDQILIMNTFVDTMLAFRSVTFFIKQLQAPHLIELEFVGGVTEDGVDNNGDGETDDDSDWSVRDYRQGRFQDGYGPKPHASMVEVPIDAQIVIRLWDPPGLGSFSGDPDDELKPGEYQGMDPDTIRLQLDDRVYTSVDCDCIQTRIWGEEDMGLEVVFSPPEGLPPASVVALIVQAGNISEVSNPPPVHARFMRDERVVFTTAGYGKAPHQVPNKGLTDGRSQPPALGFGVRGSASADGLPRLAHHFALLDSNTAHKHSVLFAHEPDDGKAFAVLGWAGIIWGFSGMNEDGLSYMITPSDTMDNPLVDRVRKSIMYAKLLSSGVPVGLKGRRMLETMADVGEAEASLAGEPNTFGWNMLLGDAAGGLRVWEMDSNILEEADQGFVPYGPEARDPANLDEWGVRHASVGEDDLRIGAHFQKNRPDIDTQILIFDAQPQRYWSSFYYRSLRTFLILGEKIDRLYGQIDLAGTIDILRSPELVDSRDSMNAVVFEPTLLMLHVAMGQMPATDGEFIPYHLPTLLAGGVTE